MTGWLGMRARPWPLEGVGVLFPVEVLLKHHPAGVDRSAITSGR